MLADAPRLTILLLFLALSILLIARELIGMRFLFRSYLTYLWTFFLFFVTTEFLSVAAGVWVLALLCFVALKEYFTLVDIRIQDRGAILAAYLSIPFMIYFIQIDWYGMFIVSIPVYAFLVIPFLVALGGPEARGTVFSIGVINLGLFLLVYCIGHIGYLARYSTWSAVLVILAVALFDLCAALLPRGTQSALRPIVLLYLVTAPLTVALAWGLSGWTGIPPRHAIAQGLLMPALAAVGRHTIGFLERDLCVEREGLRPGGGQILDSLKSFLYVAPVDYHYVRYYLT